MSIFNRPIGVTLKYNLNNGILSYRRGFFKKRQIDIDISKIPYIFITSNDVNRGKYGYFTIRDEKTKRPKPFVSLTNVLKLWLLKECDRVSNLMQLYDKQELIASFSFDIFAYLIKSGFCGEIYIVSDLYYDYLSEWEQLINTLSLDKNKIFIYYIGQEYKVNSLADCN